MRLRLANTTATITLTPGDFLASGGEAKVYTQGSYAYKIYADPTRTPPQAKLDELGRARREDLLLPDHILLDEHGCPVGVRLPYLRDAIPISSVITDRARTTHGVTGSMPLDWLYQLVSSLQHLHSHNILAVDITARNLLLDPTLHRLHLIDADSWQTPSFAATAQFDPIRDRHCSHLCEDTDWFAMAVTAFTWLTAVHPYRGQHPTLKTLDERMLDNCSVFRPEVVVPPCARIDQLPNDLKQWFIDVFDRGHRGPPPPPTNPIISLNRLTTPMRTTTVRAD